MSVCSSRLTSACRTIAVSFLFATIATSSFAGNCNNLPSHAQLTAALETAVAANTGGFGLDMWGTIVNREGEVCVLARSGENPGDQWPGSRVISAQKANTANSFSLPGLALSTANLFEAVQPGGSLFGLQFSNPVNTEVAYRGKFRKYGTANDPLVGKRIGGVNVFGGGLALYSGATLVGALGVSGDSSCADHNIAWLVREQLGLDSVPAGVGPGGTDGINYGISGKGFGHPVCGPASAGLGGSPGQEDEIADAIGAGGPPDGN
ncbi:MAG: GlcG/HbpS family heme-binding protein [Geminicoccaceae bacterium]